MADQTRARRQVRLSDQEAAPVEEIARMETEGNFSMTVRNLIVEALRHRADHRQQHPPGE